MNNMSGLLQQAQQMQRKMMEVDKKLNEMEVTGSVSGGLVTITMTGKGDVKGVKIDTSLKEDIEVLEDLILAAHNNAKDQLKSKTSEEISKATGGFGIPGFKWPL